MKYLILFFALPALAGEAQTHQTSQKAVETVFMLENLKLGQTNSVQDRIQQTINQIKQEVGQAPVQRSASALGVVPVLVWQLLFAFVIILLCLTWFWMKSALLSACLASLLALLFVALVHLAHQGHHRAIVQLQTPIFLGPAQSYPTQGELAFLQDVRILRKVHDWNLVEFYDSMHEKKKGWVPQEALYNQR